MKKLLALILALSMAFTMTACGGDKPAENTGGETGQAQTETDKKEETTTQAETKKEYNVPEFDESKRISDIEITKLKLDKKAYDVGEEISFILEWKGTAASNAWVGIVPAEVPHGDELVNDDYDLWYTYLEMLNSGEKFMAIIDLEPGKYTMRVNEYDDGGPELAWVEFTVGDGIAQLIEAIGKPDEETVTAGEIADFAFSLGGVPEDWKKGIGTPLFGTEVSGDGSDFTKGYLQKFGDVSGDDYAAYKAHFDSLDYTDEADGIYNCDWGQFQLSRNDEYNEITVTWYVY